MRWGLGPVFIYECLANSRRWQTYALRSLGVSALLFAMGTIALSRMPATGNSARDYANLGQEYFMAMIGVELALVMLAAPAATAGAICLDRARGTLAHMLMTDLSDAEIVLGKLAARLLPVFGLVACTWPVMAISSLLGGIDPIALTLAFAIIIAVAVLGCTMALALSVWARKSHEVILATYTVFIMCLLLWPVWAGLSVSWGAGSPPAWTLLANPYYVAFAPYTNPGKLEVWDYLVFFGVTLGFSALLTVLAVWRTRPVACRGSAEKSRGPRMGAMGRITRWLPGQSLDRNPVLWREWHRSRPSGWMTAMLVLLMGTTGVLCAAGAVAFWKNGTGFRPGAVWELAGVYSYMLHIMFGLLMMAAIAPTSMAEERQQGSLDLLAATALSTRAIVIGKWLGTFRLVLFMAVGPGLIVLAMATAHSGKTFSVPPGMPHDLIPLRARCYGVIVVIATILAHGALITSFGLAMAVWIKRQSRAIAISVGSFILIAVAWPVIALTASNGDRTFGRDLALLSPVAACAGFADFFMIRTDALAGRMLWYGTFWAVEVFALGMGLLWLTVRTFDHCSGRIPDQPHRLSLWSVVAIILAGMINVGSLVWAVDWRSEEVERLGLSSALSLGILAYSLLIAIGLVLAAVETATAGRARTPVFDQAPGPTARRLVLGRWWKSFRLVLLLAIGPALMALALASAPITPRYKPRFTTNAAGVRVVSSLVPATANVPHVGDVRLGQRLSVAALLIFTILVHGGAAISAGLALTPIDGWSRRALVAAVGLALLVVLTLPLYLFARNTTHPLGTTNWNFLVAVGSLFAMLVTGTSFTVGENLWSVMFWDILLTLFAIGLSWWTVQAWQHRLSGVPEIQPSRIVETAKTLPATTDGS